MGDLASHVRMEAAWGQLVFQGHKGISQWLLAEQMHEHMNVCLHREAAGANMHLENNILLTTTNHIGKR